MPYFFEEWNWETKEDVEISGEKYINLIEICFKYTDTFSLVFDTLERANNFCGLICERINKVSFGKHRNYLAYFSCTEKAKRQLCLLTGSFFDLVNSWGEKKPEEEKPENLAFYRKDGSVFFWSETHEGMCALYEQEGEDVTDIIKSGNWHIIDKDSPYYNIPKKSW